MTWKQFDLVTPALPGTWLEAMRRSASILSFAMVPGQTTRMDWDSVTSEMKAFTIKNTSLGLSPPNLGGIRFPTSASRCRGMPWQSSVQLWNLGVETAS